VPAPVPAAVPVVVPAPVMPKKSIKVSAGIFTTEMLGLLQYGSSLLVAVLIGFIMLRLV